MQLADFDEAIRVNLRSACLVTDAALPAMRRAKWGRIIFMSSVAANIGGTIGPHYAASKAGMLGIMHGYASLLVKEGITSNAISPGLIESDMVRVLVNVTPDRVPVGRYGTARGSRINRRHARLERLHDRPGHSPERRDVLRDLTGVRQARPSRRAVYARNCRPCDVREMPDVPLYKLSSRRRAPRL